MSIARDLLLKSTPEGVRLYQQPASVLNASLEKLPSSKKLVKQQVEIDNKDLPMNKGTQFNSNTNWIDATFTPGTAQEFGFKLGQAVGGKGETVVGYNTAGNELYIANAKDGKTDKLTVKPADGKIRLQVLFDKSSVEVFVNGGERVLTTLIFPDGKATGWSVFAKEGKVMVADLKVWDLSK